MLKAFDSPLLLDWSNSICCCRINQMHLQHSKSDGINMLIVLLKVHDEREIDRVIGIDGIQLIGINNRNLGVIYSSLVLARA